MRQTLCYVFRPGEDGRRQVLLGRKKRGFGAGMIMGPGGKTKPGETATACAIREVAEETGIMVDPGALAWRAELTFVFPARPELDAVVSVFFGLEWSGEPRESDEMVPVWFDVGSLPLDQMWDDDAYWLPRVLAGEALSGTVTYDEACKLVTRVDLMGRPEAAGIVADGNRPPS